MAIADATDLPMWRGRIQQQVEDNKGDILDLKADLRETKTSLETDLRAILKDLQEIRITVAVSNTRLALMAGAGSVVGSSAVIVLATILGHIKI